VIYGRHKDGDQEIDPLTRQHCAPRGVPRPQRLAATSRYLLELSRNSTTRPRIASALRAKSVDGMSRFDWTFMLPLPERSQSRGGSLHLDAASGKAGVS
jgi:hypothetical protein